MASVQRPFVPADFAVPTELHAAGIHLLPLGPEHNEADHAAWTSSVDHIHATPGWEHSSWPHPMSLEENRHDLEAHAADFAARTGFTYTVLDDAGTVIGCVYIYPPREAAGGEAAGGEAAGDGADAEVRSWVSAEHARLDAGLYRAIRDWLAREWPFGAVRYAERNGRGG